MEKINKKDIRLQTKEALQDFFVSHGAPSFKGGQVYQWLWQKGAHDFDIMTNLSLEHRNILKSYFEIKLCTLIVAKLKFTKPNLLKGSEHRITFSRTDMVSCSIQC